LGVVSVPGGNYKISSGYTDGKFKGVVGGATWQGYGEVRSLSRTVTRLLPAADRDTVFMVGRALVVGGSGYSGAACKIKDIKIYGISGTDSASIGLFMNDADVTIENVNISNITNSDTGRGIAYPVGNSSRFINVETYFCDIGFQGADIFENLGIAETLQGLYFENCRFLYSKIQNVNLMEAYATVFNTCSFEEQWQYPVHQLLGGDLINVSGSKWYLLGADLEYPHTTVEPTWVAFNTTQGTEVASSLLVNSEGEYYWTTSGADSLFVYTADTSTIEYGGNRQTKRPFRDVTFRHITLEYCTETTFINPYVEMGEDISEVFMQIDTSRAIGSTY
jgi:hypothetical protein